MIDIFRICLVLRDAASFRVYSASVFLLQGDNSFQDIRGRTYHRGFIVPSTFTNSRPSSDSICIAFRPQPKVSSFMCLHSGGPSSWHELKADQGSGWECGGVGGVCLPATAKLCGFSRKIVRKG